MSLLEVLEQMRLKFLGTPPERQEELPEELPDHPLLGGGHAVQLLLQPKVLTHLDTAHGVNARLQFFKVKMNRKMERDSLCHLPGTRA